MASQKRNKTKYPGVFYRLSKRIGGPGEEKVFYVVYKKDGKTKEEKAGRQYQNGMTPAKAATIRGELIEGRRKSRGERRKKAAERKWTIDALWNEYKSHRDETTSFKPEIYRYEKYIKTPFGDKEPRNIVSLDCERIKLNMKKGGAAPQSIKHVLSLVMRIINFGTNQGLCRGISFKINMPKVDNKKTEDLTPEELARLLDVLEHDENRAVANIMKLALFTGMRKGELFKLQWRDINYNRGFLLIRDPKGGKSQEIPLNRQASALLEDWQRTKGSPYIFPGRGGKQRVTVAREAKRIKEEAGLPKGFRPLHGLRHLYASMLASSGKVDMYTLQKLLTHKSPAMTQRYAHLRDDALQRAADLAGDLISDAMKTSKEIRNG